MKKINLLSLIVLMLGISAAVMAQTPQAINYQGIARNGSGAPLANQSLGLRFTISDTSGTDFYQETQTATTNAYGLYNVQIGKGNAVSGSMASVAWLTGPRVLKVEIDPAGGTSYTQVGTPTHLMSVPYALAANSVQATSNGGGGLVGTTSANLWWGLYENGLYRGYLGSYSGSDNSDVDFGTGASNSTGAVHLTIMASPKLTVDSSGKVGIGITTPAYPLQIDGVTGTFNDNGIRINNATASSGWSFYSSAAGNLIVGKTSNLGQFDGTTGAYSTLSDARLKTKIQSLESVLPRVMSLDAKRYEFAKDNPTHKMSIGFLAQDLKAQFPEYVYTHTANDGNPAVTDQLGVDYAGLSVISIKAIQEQQSTIEKLEKKIAELEQRLKNIEK